MSSERDELFTKLCSLLSEYQNKTYIMQLMVNAMLIFPEDEETQELYQTFIDIEDLMNVELFNNDEYSRFIYCMKERREYTYKQLVISLSKFRCRPMEGQDPSTYRCRLRISSPIHKVKFNYDDCELYQVHDLIKLYQNDP